MGWLTLQYGVCVDAHRRLCRRFTCLASLCCVESGRLRAAWALVVCLVGIPAIDSWFCVWSAQFQEVRTCAPLASNSSLCFHRVGNERCLLMGSLYLWLAAWHSASPCPALKAIALIWRPGWVKPPGRALSLAVCAASCSPVGCWTVVLDGATHPISGEDSGRFDPGVGCAIGLLSWMGSSLVG